MLHAQLVEACNFPQFFTQSEFYAGVQAMNFKRIFAVLFLELGFVAAVTAQSFTGVVQQRHFSIPREVLFTLAGEIKDAPTPEEEAFGFSASKMLSRPVPQLLAEMKKRGLALSADQFTYHFGANVIRVDINLSSGNSLFGKNIVYILRSDKKLNWVILPEQQAYLELSADENKSVVTTAKDLLQSFSQNQTAANEPTAPEFQKTAERAAVNGFACTRYTASRSGQLLELWGTAQFPELRRAFEDFVAQMELGEIAELQESGMWPQEMQDLPILSKQLSQGRGMNVLEITSIKPQKVDAVLFEIPPAYKKLDMQQLLQEMLLKKFMR